MTPRASELSRLPRDGRGKREPHFRRKFPELSPLEEVKRRTVSSLRQTPVLDSYPLPSMLVYMYIS